MSEKTPISQIIKERLRKAGVQFRANDNISAHITEEEKQLLRQEIEGKFAEVLKSLVIDVEDDHNTKDTHRRVAKMYINEIFSGRYDQQPDSTDFPNSSAYEGLYVTGPISIRSTCAHHFQNIVGHCWVGIFPGDRVIGLSKFNRIVDWISTRPQIQEELTSQIADAIMEATKASGVAVVIKATHHCMTHRGVKEHESDMTTSVMRGELKENQVLKNEFMALLSGMKKYNS